MRAVFLGFTVNPLASDTDSAPFLGNHQSGVCQGSTLCKPPLGSVWLGTCYNNPEHVEAIQFVLRCFNSSFVGRSVYLDICLFVDLQLVTLTKHTGILIRMYNKELFATYSMLLPLKSKLFYHLL